MLRQLWHRLFRRSIEWERSLVPLGDLEILTRSNLAGLLLAQEKARLDFLSAQEEYRGHRTVAHFETLQQRLLHLQATNALVQSLLNEQRLEQLLKTKHPPEFAPAVGKSR
jgi:hypothetical protein